MREMTDLRRLDEVNVLAENEQEFEQLLREGDVDKALGRMDCRGDLCLKALKEYDPYHHRVMGRRDKEILDNNGHLTGTKERAKLPIPYQVYINEIAVPFLFGQPVQWQQQSEGTDEAFEAFLDAVRKTRFDAKIRQVKRVAGAETECALLFRAYQDDDGQAALQLRVLARSKDDFIYTRFDEYENLVAFGWRYSVRGSDDEVEERLIIWTRHTEYDCSRQTDDKDWQVTAKPNKVGKIPVILFRQEKEWAGVERLIEREEDIASRTADTNDYFADPIMVAAADIVKNLPDKQEEAKVLVTTDTEHGVGNAVTFLTWDNAPQSKENELTWLQEQILSKTFTPDIKLDTLKSLGNVSGKALRTVMLLADIKASKRKEVYDEMLDRTASLLITIIGNILDTKLASQCQQLKVRHVWQEPFGDDITEALENITKAVDGGILSTESAIELNPLVRDVPTERRRLDEDGEKRSKEQTALFGSGAGTAFAANSNAKTDEGEETEGEEEGEEEGNK